MADSVVVRCHRRSPRSLLVVSLAVFLFHAGPAAGQDAGLDPPEVRALWVDAFHAGIRSPAEADELVAAALRARLNTLFVQVRRRGDVLYLKSNEPPLADPAYTPGFDALAYVIERGHRAGLSVHAWVNAMPVWRNDAPPADPRHLFHRHGPGQPGDDNWFTATPAGDHLFPVGYFLDPGHPAAADFLAGVYVSLVRDYDIDGIHFDYIRYPETEERLPRGAAVGYNAVSLRRFQAATGRHDVPGPGDEQWTMWRRQQVTHLVRRVALEARAAKARIIVSAAVIPWGAPPAGERDFADTAPMQRVFQDWHAWLNDGLIDIAVPMNYARETDDRVRGWFDGWVRWEKAHGHGRAMVAGLGAYRNTPAHTLAQVARARVATSMQRLLGVSFFSYASPVLPDEVRPATEPPSLADVAAVGVDRFAFLADGVASAPAAFARPAPFPTLPWVAQPDTGAIAGQTAVTTGTAHALVRRAGWFRRTTRVDVDGNGWFGVARLRPGRYRVQIDHGGVRTAPAWVTVSAGQVTRVGGEAPK